VATLTGDKLSLPVLCGQLLVVGFEGPELPDVLREQLTAGERGGVILFKRNLPDAEAANALCRSVAEAVPTELPPYISLDQEGGRVVRLPAPVLALPPMRTFGEIGDPDLVRRAAAIVARQLAGLGFNLDFAPVLDVDSNPKNPVIGDRSFGADPDLVGRLGRAFVEGLSDGGILSCGKHFPGHGDTLKDSHVDLPVVVHDKKRLDGVELPPFRTACLRGVPALMSAHVVYEKLDPGVPATLSRKIMTTLLRNEIGFRGVSISDDLEMRALSDRYEVEDSAVRAISAGCDVLLVCKDLELARRAHAALLERAQGDTGFLRRCIEAVDRSLAARRSRPPRPARETELEGLLGSDEARELLDEIAARRA
jgi:beta-N-acetylhexosaminidase